MKSPKAKTTKPKTKAPADSLLRFAKLKANAGKLLGLQVTNAAGTQQLYTVAEATDFPGCENWIYAATSRTETNIHHFQLLARIKLLVVGDGSGTWEA